LLSDIVEAVGGKIEIICDGGIRRGTHILKALALGADACSIGRPYLYGLAAAGQAGVEAVLAKFESELIRNMMLMGVNKLSQIDISKIRKR
jgi:L-lactate dehydrogenase (cytochrome)